VYLVGAARAFEIEGSRAVMDQTSRSSRTCSRIIIGDSRFPQYRQVLSQRVSLSKTKAFDLGRNDRQLSAGRPDRPGIVRVFCDIHSHERVHLVFNHPFFLMTDAEGATIENVPPGKYWRDQVEQKSSGAAVRCPTVASPSWTSLR
jgi:hypothetical protein